MTDFDMQETLSPPLCNHTQIKAPEGHDAQPLEGPMSKDIRDEAVQKRCVPTPWRRGQTDGHGNMADGLFDGHGMQQTRIRPMAVGTWCSGDNLDTEATHLCQQKTKKNATDGD